MGLPGRESLVCREVTPSRTLPAACLLAGLFVPALMARAQTWDVVKLLVFVGILAYVGNLARKGLLPRTRPIVPGELAVSD